MCVSASPPPVVLVLGNRARNLWTSARPSGCIAGGARDASPVVRLRHTFTAEGNHFAAAARLVERSEIGSSQGNVL